MSRAALHCSPSSETARSDTKLHREAAYSLLLFECVQDAFGGVPRLVLADGAGDGGLRAVPTKGKVDGRFVCSHSVLMDTEKDIREVRVADFGLLDTLCVRCVCGRLVEFLRSGASGRSKPSSGK